MPRRLRDQVHDVLEHPDPGNPICRVIDAALIGLIFLNVVAMMLESEPTFTGWQQPLRYLAVLAVLAFTLEYALRIWSAPADPRYRAPIRGRLRFATGFFPLIDLLSIAPYLVAWSIGEPGAAGLVRVVWLAKLGRHSRSLRLLGSVFRAQRRELLATGFVLMVLLAVASCAMFLVEHHAQPDVFRSIPATLWWSIVTITTVGYGDVVPVTTGGKIVGASVAALGVLAIAIPTSILGSGFHAALRSRTAPMYCPHCGQEVHPVPEE